MPAPRSLALLGLLTLVPAARAADLPPQTAPAYTGVYHAVTRTREEGSEEWKLMADDTVTIAVRDKQSRWDRKSDGSTQINDAPTRTTTSFGGKIPAGTAVRTQAPFVAIGWEFGYTNVAKATAAAPEVLGTRTIAGQECTRLRYKSAQYGEPEFCVTKSGIVLRFANASDDVEATYEATSITEAPPDPARFVTPKDLTVEERRRETRPDLKL